MDSVLPDTTLERGHIRSTAPAPQAAPRVTGFLRRHSLVSGVALMFLLTWPIELANAGVLPFKVPLTIAVVVGWGFIIASLLMTGLTQGRAAVVALVRRFVIWRVGWQWYLVAFLLFPVIFLSAVLLNAAISHTRIEFSTVMAYQLFGASADLPILIVPFFLFDALTNGEEMGWRGYILPRLRARHGALVASLILGMVWGFWHLPKFLAADSTSAFGWFVLKTMADSVLYTWLYTNSRGSLLLATLLHASGNTAGVFLPIATTASATNMSVLIIAIALEGVAAVLVTIVFGPTRLSRTAPAQSVV